MKGRDLLILAGVLLLGGFAVADVLRDSATSEPREAQPPATEPATTSTEEEPALRQLPPVSGVGGDFTFTEVGSCAVREVDLPTGLVYLNVVRASTCELWAAPVTAKVAVGIGEPRGDAVPFRFIDLSAPGVELGGGEALFGALFWSEDGQRAAWCNGQRIGFDLELGARRRQLPDCPTAYSPDGEVVYARGDRLFVEDRPGLQASGTITKVHYGSDGSVAVVVEGRRIERYVDGELADALDLQERYHGRQPTFSPDNCAAAYRAGDRIRILDVGCSRLGPGPNGLVFPGHAAAWSSNGEWIAIGGPTEVTFYDLRGTAEPVVWDVGAVQLAWRRR